MRWNCDYLATKIPELRVVIKKYAVDIILLQETKLGLEDPTPLLKSFDVIRTDWKGSGTHTRRGGGLITYIKKGLQYSVPQCPAVIPLERQCILLPTSSRRSISITNVYIPPESSTHTKYLSALVASQLRLSLPLFHPFIHLSIHPSIHSSIHPYIHPSIHPFTHPSIFLFSFF